MIERTLVVVKPDGVKRAMVGRILSRFEDAGLKIVAMRMQWVKDDFAKRHYREEDIAKRHGERVWKTLLAYIQEGPIIAVLMEGVNAIEVVRKLVGSTYPNEAPPGTIRGDFGHISKVYANEKGMQTYNLIHASANKADVAYEVSLWFAQQDMHSYKTVH